MKNIKVISSIYTGSSLSVVFSDGKNMSTKIIEKSHINWKQILTHYKKKAWNKVFELIDVGQAIERNFRGKFTVKAGSVYYGNQALHGYVFKRIIQFMSEGLPYQNLLRFAEKLYANPSERAREDLFRFLEHGNFPISDSGNFLAYKKIDTDGYSKTAGTLKLIQGQTDSKGRILNTVGQVIECKREDINSDPNTGCSGNRLHCGTHKYAEDFGAGTMIIVEVDPKDCCVVPHECDSQKLGVCKYKVLAIESRKLDEVKDIKFAKKSQNAAPKRDKNGRFARKR